MNVIDDAFLQESMEEMLILSASSLADLKLWSRKVDTPSMNIVGIMLVMVSFRERPYDKYRQVHIPVSSEGLLASFVDRNWGLITGKKLSDGIG